MNASETAHETATTPLMTFFSASSAGGRVAPSLSLFSERTRRLIYRTSHFLRTTASGKAVNNDVADVRMNYTLTQRTNMRSPIQRCDPTELLVVAEEFKTDGRMYTCQRKMPEVDYTRPTA
jgi:hypothetical protein